MILVDWVSKNTFGTRSSPLKLKLKINTADFIQNPNLL